jgi:hypothetical protein
MTRFISARWSSFVEIASQTAAIAEQRLGNLSYETEQHSEFGAGCFRQCWPLLWIPKSPAWNDRQRRSGSFVLDC